MSDFFLNLIDSNQQINYGLIFTLSFGYIFFLWIAISIWVYSDAKKRYESSLYPILIFFFVLLFNLPALIFYIMIRPDFTFEEEELMEAAIYNNKKLSPIVFAGEQGFDINLNIRVMPKVKDGKGKDHEMDVDLSWVPVQKIPSIDHVKQVEQLEQYVAHRDEKLSDAYEEKVETEALPQIVAQVSVDEDKLPMEDVVGSIGSKISNFTVAFKKNLNAASLKIKKQYFSGKKVENDIKVENAAIKTEKKSLESNNFKKWAKKNKKKHKNKHR